MTNIYFGDMKINHIEKNSGHFTGDNQQVGWLHQDKTNEGFGRATGLQNRVNWNQTILIDTDFIDIHNKRNDKRNESG